MTTQEFSNEFDVLLSNFLTLEYGKSTLEYGKSSSVLEIILNEYEKSVLLSQAQEEIVIALYNGNLTGKSFEETEELRRSLDNLLRTTELQPCSEEITGVSETSKFFSFPKDDEVWFITYEHITTDKGIVKVVPMRLDEWHKVSKNPFKKPNKNKVIRLDYNSDTLELIPEESIIIKTYLIKYLTKPTPIVLTDLPDGLSIDGESKETNCKLNTALHRNILERAVQLAYRKISQASNK